MVVLVGKVVVTQGTAVVVALGTVVVTFAAPEGAVVVTPGSVVEVDVVVVGFQFGSTRLK